MTEVPQSESSRNKHVHHPQEEGQVLLTAAVEGSALRPYPQKPFIQMGFMEGAHPGQLWLLVGRH